MSRRAFEASRSMRLPFCFELIGMDSVSAASSLLARREREDLSLLWKPTERTTLTRVREGRPRVGEKIQGRPCEPREFYRFASASRGASSIQPP